MGDLLPTVADLIAVGVGVAGAGPTLWRGADARIRKRVLQRFWGLPRGARRNIVICYPSYPNPHVGRTVRVTGHYVSDHDSRAVHMLYDTLGRLGYNCTSRLVADPRPVADDLPPDATVVLVCSPRLDPNSGLVVTGHGRFGGNALSSWFYNNHPEFGINVELIGGGRKQFRLPTFNVQSPMDDTPPARDDCGILVRLRVGERQFVLCWGIHGQGTLGTVQAALGRKALSKLPRGEEDVVAHVRTRPGQGPGQDSLVEIIQATSLQRTDVLPSVTKPDPYAVGGTLRPQTPVFGIGHLWARRGNAEAMKDGRYDDLRVIAADLDLPLSGVPDPSRSAAKAMQASGAARRDGEDVVRVVRTLCEWGASLLVLRGEEDPLLCPNVARAVEECRQRGVWTALHTDGYRLDAVRAFHLMEGGVSEILLSLGDVSSAQNYADARRAPRERFEEVRRNCRRLLDLRQRNAFTTRVGLSLTMTEATSRHVAQTVAELKRWVEDVGPFDYAVTEPVTCQGEGREQPQCLMSDEEYCGHSRTLAGELTKAAVAHHCPVPKRRSTVPGHGVIPSQGPSCLAAPLWLRVRADGAVFLCGGVLREENSLGSIWCDAPSSIQDQALHWIARHPRLGAADCPVRLCRLAAVSDVLGGVAQAQGDDQAWRRTCNWLEALSVQSRQSPWGSMVSPSVPGLWEEEAWPQGTGAEAASTS